MVNIVSVAGEPIEPPEVCAKFRNAIGSIIRTKMVLDLMIPDWPTVPEGRKEAMWQMLRQTFILPRGTQDRVRHYARKMLGESFRRWKSELNTKYVKTGRTPFADYGEITQAQWEEFVRQKSTDQSLALSKKILSRQRAMYIKSILARVDTKGRPINGAVKERLQ